MSFSSCHLEVENQSVTRNPTRDWVGLGYQIRDHERVRVGFKQIGLGLGWVIKN